MEKLYEESDILNLSKNEEIVFKLWKDVNLLQKIKKSRELGDKWNFLDGPPFVNGNPHHGHLLVSTIKDTLARFHSNLGHCVNYQIGFDCHGLPMEQAAEKQLGKKISSNATLDEIRIFNETCQEIQDKCSNKFETVLSRLGRQFESENTYYTSNVDYMNALWKNFKVLWDKGLIYRGKKVMPYSYGCQTPLSNFEANQNYQDVTHTSLYLKFKLVDSDEFFLVWTTTPWSLLANQALCLNPKLEYVLVQGNEKYWVNKELYSSIFKKDEPILKTCLGSELKNILYLPVFNFFGQEIFKTLNDDYVTNQAGTGIVHLAPLFGADDLRVCIENKIINNDASNLPDFLDGEIKIITDMIISNENIKGQQILDLVNKVIQNVKERELYFKKASIVHKYPLCYRTDTPLIYLAQDSWFLNVQMIKDDLINNNQKIKWFPENVGKHRFANWLNDAQDWCLSRNRFWGTPIPIWKSDDNDYICFGDKTELPDYIDNLHRQFIDEIIIYENGKKYKRINDVFDCWYESGMAGIAKGGKESYKLSYPVDFIAESIDQTRGWFYTLNVLSTAIFNQPAFKEVIVSGLILASDGMKMSKRLNNYTPPDKILEKYGADVLRLYLLSSPATQAQEFRFVDSELLVITKKMLPYFHAHKLLVDCATNLKLQNIDINLSLHSKDPFDIWLLNLTYKLQLDIMDTFYKLELFRVPNIIFKFIDSLTNIWVKFSRDRLKNNYVITDTINSLSTLFRVLTLTNTVISPMIPFNTDFLYNYLNYHFKNSKYDSIHTMFTNPNVTYDSNIIDSVENLYNIIEIIRSSRKEIKQKFNRPLNSPIRNMEVYLPSIYQNKINREFDKFIIEQCNIENLQYFFDKVESIITPNKGAIGKKFKKEGKNVIKLINDSKVDDLLQGKVIYSSVVITNEFFNISSQKIEKENYYSVQSGIYLILLDVTLDDELIWKTKLALWKREIQELRKQLNFKFWDKIDLLVDRSTVSEDFNQQWINHFENLINAKVKLTENLNDPYQFNYDSDNIKYSIELL